MVGKNFKYKAEELALGQKEISISSFFEKNRHLLGFDNPLRALSTTVKEICDNSLDACEEMKVLPDIKVTIKQLSETKFKVTVLDNGPGVVKEQIPRVFAKLLYGSKFGKNKQGRGQQGIGVCMPPETLIPLGDGKVLPIREIVEEKPNADLFVLTPDLKLALGKINRFWRIPSPPVLVSLKTLGGKLITVTPENAVLIRTENGFEWKEAENIKIGDYIAVSRKLASHVREEKIAIFDFLDNDTRIDNYKFVIKVLYELKEKYGSWNNVAEKFKLKKDQLKGWCKKSIKRRPTKRLLELFCDDLNIPEEILIKNCRRVGKLGTYVQIPIFVNEDFMSFLGYISGDGASQKNRLDRWGRNISFWNSSLVLRKDFENIVYNLFGARVKNFKHSKGRGEMVQFSSSLVARLINLFGIPSGKKFSTFSINPMLHRKDLLRPYLRALFDCEGSVSVDRRTISFMIRNERMIYYVSLFLLQFSITNRINKINKDIRLVISGKKNIKKFYEELCFLNPQKKKKLEKILTKNKFNEKLTHLDKIPFVRKQLRFLKKQLHVSYKELPYPHIFSRNGAVSYPVLQDTYNFFLSKTRNKMVPLELQELYCLLNSDVVWLPVINKTNSKPNYPFVYDLTMQQGNNFIANGVLVHNSASVLYGQLTTGKATIITSKIGANKPAHHYHLKIDIHKNEPDIIKDEIIDFKQDHGTQVEIELEGKYQKGRQGVEEYLKQTSIANPHVEIVYISPENEKIVFKRAVNKLPVESKAIKLHPYGVEIGILMRMLTSSKAKTLQAFLSSEFSRVSIQLAKQICDKALINSQIKPKEVTHNQCEALIKVIKETKIMAPPLNCLSPIGENAIVDGLKKEIKADFYAAVSRRPSVYRGFPFAVECGIAYGGELAGDDLIRVIRLANKVPLQYQQSACAITKSIIQTSWRNYGLSQSKGALPTGPVLVLVHVASVWVPFTSEAKEAIAHYPEIIKEIKLALQDAGRRLGSYMRRVVKAKQQQERISLFDKYIPELANSLSSLTGEKKEKIIIDLNKVFKKSLKEIMINGEKNEQN